MIDINPAILQEGIEPSPNTTWDDPLAIHNENDPFYGLPTGKIPDPVTGKLN